MLKFDAASHTYTVDGVVIPSVTQVLGILDDLSMIKPDVLRLAADRGTAVHRMVDMYNSNLLDIGSLDDQLLEYFTAYMDFLSDTGFKVEESEEQIYSDAYGYAGTRDIKGRLGVYRAVVDVKTSVVLLDSVGPQLAAYQNAKQDNIQKRYALQLQPGKYKLTEFKDKDDFKIFLSCLTIHKWRNK